MEKQKEKPKLNSNLQKLGQTIGLIGEIRNEYDGQSEDDIYDMLIRCCLLLSNIILFNRETNEVTEKKRNELLNYYYQFATAHAAAKFIHNVEAAKAVSALAVKINIMYKQLVRYFNDTSLEQVLTAPPIEIEFVSDMDYSNITLLRDLFTYFRQNCGLNVNLKDDLTKSSAVFISSLQFAIEFQKDIDYYSNITTTYAAARNYIQESYIEIIRSLLLLKADSLRIKKSDIDTEKLKDKLGDTVNELYGLLSPNAPAPIALDRHVFQSLAAIASEVMELSTDEIDADKALKLIDTINSFVEKSKKENMTV